MTVDQESDENAKPQNETQGESRRFISIVIETTQIEKGQQIPIQRPPDNDQGEEQATTAPAKEESAPKKTFEDMAIITAGDLTVTARLPSENEKCNRMTVTSMGEDRIDISVVRKEAEELSSPD